MWLDDVGCACWVDFCFSCVVALLVGEGLRESKPNPVSQIVVGQLPVVGYLVLISHLKGISVERGAWTT